MFLKSKDVGWDLEFYVPSIPYILFDEVFVSNTITILVAIGTIIFALIAIIAGIINYSMDREADVIKNYLEETSNLYINYDKDFNTVVGNRYNIELFLIRYNNLYEHFVVKNERLMKLGEFYWTLIHCACGCFVVAITLDIVYLYKISGAWAVILCVIAVVLLNPLWNKHIKKIFSIYLIPESYDIDFPSYEDLLIPNENIFVPGRKVVENLPARLLGASSYIKIEKDIGITKPRIKLYVVQAFRIKSCLRVEYEDGSSDSYDFNFREAAVDQKSGYFCIFELIKNTKNISRMVLEMETYKEGRNGTLAFIFKTKSDNEIFTCWNIMETNYWGGIAPNYYVIKPRFKN